MAYQDEARDNGDRLDGVADPLLLVSFDLCPYVQRAAIALLEKGASFRRVWIDLSNRPEWFKSVSPLGKVPLLRVVGPAGEETILFESSVICEYLEETQPGPKLHPADPLERALHRAWMEFASSILASVWSLETARDREGVGNALRALAYKFARVEEALEAGPFFAGPRFSLVDAAFAPVFRYFDVFDEIADTRLFDEIPKVRAWRAELARRPSVRAAVCADYGTRLRRFLVDHEAYLLAYRDGPRAG